MARRRLSPAGRARVLLEFARSRRTRSSASCRQTSNVLCRRTTPPRQRHAPACYPGDAIQLRRADLQQRGEAVGQQLPAPRPAPPEVPPALGVHADATAQPLEGEAPRTAAPVREHCRSLARLPEPCIHLARAFARSRSSNSRVLLNDACVTSQVRAALMAHPKIRLVPPGLTFEQGIGDAYRRVSGLALGPTGARRCSSGRWSGFGEIGDTRQPPIPPRVAETCSELKAPTALTGSRLAGAGGFCDIISARQSAKVWPSQ